MTEKIRIRPVEGKIVPVPYQHRRLNPDGENVLKTQYWARRLKCGDVEIAAEPKPKKSRRVGVPGPIVQTAEEGAE